MGQQQASCERRASKGGLGASGHREALGSNCPRSVQETLWSIPCLRWDGCSLSISFFPHYSSALAVTKYLMSRDLREEGFISGLL